MKKLALITTIVLFVSAPSLAEDRLSKQHTQMLYPTVRVRTQNATGSGTIVYCDDRDDSGVYDTFIFTNHHVVSNAIRITKKWNSLLGRNEDLEVTDLVTVEIFNYRQQSKTAGRVVYDAEIVAYEAEEDIAVLRLTTNIELKYVARLIDKELVEKLRMFQPVFAVGCSLGHDPIASSGMLTGLSNIIEHKSYWMMSAQIIFGNSGGAVFLEHKDNYYFVGIPSRIAGTRNQVVEHMAYFIPPTRLHSWITRQHLNFLSNGKATPREAFKIREKIRKQSRKEPEDYQPSNLQKDKDEPFEF